MADWFDIDGHWVNIQTRSFPFVPSERPFLCPPIIGVSEDTINSMTDKELGGMIRAGLPYLAEMLRDEAEYHNKQRLENSQGVGVVRQQKKKVRTAVYLVKCVDRFKIGISADPVRRVREIQRVAPDTVFSIGLYWYESGGEARAMEVALHNNNASYRTNGEWFCLPDDTTLDGLMAKLMDGRQ